MKHLLALVFVLVCAATFSTAQDDDIYGNLSFSGTLVVSGPYSKYVSLASCSSDAISIVPGSVFMEPVQSSENQVTPFGFKISGYFNNSTETCQLNIANIGDTDPKFQFSASMSKHKLLFTYQDKSAANDMNSVSFYPYYNGQFTVSMDCNSNDDIDCTTNYVAYQDLF